MNQNTKFSDKFEKARYTFVETAISMILKVKYEGLENNEHFKNYIETHYEIFNNKPSDNFCITFPNISKNKEYYNVVDIHRLFYPEKEADKLTYNLFFDKFLSKSPEKITDTDNKPNSSFFINLICLRYVINEGLISVQEKNNTISIISNLHESITNSKAVTGLHKKIENKLNLSFETIKRTILTIMMFLLGVNSTKYCIKTPKEYDHISYYFPKAKLTSNCKEMKPLLNFVNWFLAFLIADAYFYGYTVFYNDEIKKHIAFNFANRYPDIFLKTPIDKDNSLSEELIKQIQKTDLMLLLAAENTKEDVIEVIQKQNKIGRTLDDLIETCDELASELVSISPNKNKKKGPNGSICYLLRYTDIIDNLSDINKSDIN